jgi:hypothetical protein
MKTPEIICPKCLQPFAPTDPFEQCCPKCNQPSPGATASIAASKALAAPVWMFNDSRPRAVPPPLPGRFGVKAYITAAVLGLVTLVISGLLLRHWFGPATGRAWVVFASLLLVSYLAAAAIFKNPVARVLGALLFAAAIAALLVGLFFAGCALVLKFLPK